MELKKAENFISQLLKSKLPAGLYYHSYEHTFDVLNAAAELAREEGITNVDELTILKTAALFHDCGFVSIYKNHEEESCKIAREILPQLNYSAEQVEVICNLIMKTKYGTEPETLLEKILCDADLDYLGRDDYEIISERLRRELMDLGKIKDVAEWNRLQVQFLQEHRYYTIAAQKKRNAKKREQLQKLKARD